MKEKITTAIDFLNAFEAGDVNTIDRLLAPNFRDIRKPHIEISKFEYLIALELFFKQRTACEFIIHHLIAQDSTIAVEISIVMVIAGKELRVERHDLLLFEDGLIAAIHEYGDDAGETI